MPSKILLTEGASGKHWHFAPKSHRNSYKQICYQASPFATILLENLTNYIASIIREHGFVMVILYLASTTSIVLVSSIQHRKTEMQY